MDFTKFGMCIDIVEIWFGIVNGQISSNLIELSALNMTIFCFPDDTCKLSTCQGILTKLGTCIDIKEIWYGISNGQISSIFDYFVNFWQSYVTTTLTTQRRGINYDITFLFLHKNIYCEYSVE